MNIINNERVVFCMEMMILVAKTPAKEGVAKIAARFARHFYPSTPPISKILDPPLERATFSGF